MIKPAGSSNRSAMATIAVIGAGIAGATCARALSAAGCAVHVVDKARGPGGRLATRRLEWLDPHGQPRSAKLDHGAPGFAARSLRFQQFLARTAGPQTVSTWLPAQAASSRSLNSNGPLHVPVPDMPAWCRHLLGGVKTTWSFAVDSLQRGPLGWQIGAAGTGLPGHFDAVVLALPPAQAAPLLMAHQPAWAQGASQAPMQPCWTLMGVARASAQPPIWDLALPEQGPLAWVMRNDARPGRAAAAGEAHWVAHARADWSRQHLEQPAAWVQARMQAALQALLQNTAGSPDWLHAVVHRWRYAVPQTLGAAPAQPCWWDANSGLGACGDFLGTRGDTAGVEGAWQSAQALADVMLSNRADSAPAPQNAFTAVSGHHAAA